MTPFHVLYRDSQISIQDRARHSDDADFLEEADSVYIAGQHLLEIIAETRIWIRGICIL